MNRSHVRCPTADRRRVTKPPLLTSPSYLLHFCSSPFHARIPRDAAPSRRDTDHWEFAKGRGHLFATRMSFIVQIFSLLYSYRYIVTLRNIDCDGGHYYVAVPLLYFLIFLLNKCDDAENINICLSLLHRCRSSASQFPPLSCQLVLSHLIFSRYSGNQFNCELHKSADDRTNDRNKSNSQNSDLTFNKWTAHARSRHLDCPIRIDPRGLVTVFRIILMGFLRRAICEAHY